MRTLAASALAVAVLAGSDATMRATFDDTTMNLRPATLVDEGPVPGSFRALEEADVVLRASRRLAPAETRGRRRRLRSARGS